MKDADFSRYVGPMAVPMECAGFNRCVSAMATFMKGTGFIENCIRNVRTNAPEAQSWLAPRFSVGKGDSTKFVTESRRDGARTYAGTHTPHIHKAQRCGLNRLRKKAFEIAISVRARLQSCRNGDKINLGFSP
jgi:hypothetical protein